MYHAKCPDCDDNYTGEAGRSFQQRVSGILLKHSYEKAHQNVSSEDFRILVNDISKNSFKRKISEALFIQQLQPSLNTRFKPLTVITKRSILDVAATLDPPLICPFL